MLTLQFFFPLSAQARDPHQVAMEISSLEEAIELDTQLKTGVGAFMILFIACSTSDNSAIPGLFVQRTDDRVHLDILPATGLFPSAP